MYKPCPLVFPAKSTDCIDDLIHLLQALAVHLVVEFIKAVFDGAVIQSVGFCVALVEHGECGISVTKVWRVAFQVGFQQLKVSYQQDTSYKSLCDVNSGCRKKQVLFSKSGLP